MKILFLDESGDHSLTKLDEQYPMFVLAGIIMDASYHETVAIPRFEQLKEELFGNRSIVFHTADITRNKNGFERVKEKEFRERFYSALNAVMLSLDYMVVAAAVRKKEHLLQYGLAALDPYLLSLECLVERFAFELKMAGEQGIIIAECRNSILDNELELAFLNLKIQGTRYISAAEIKSCITQLATRKKEENIAGLQIADLVATPIGRYVLGKPPKPDFEIVKQKFRKSSEGKFEGYGLVVLPKIQKARPATQFPPNT
ncbi:MAG: DUF3800 domain-containing protein [Bacteroidota bacterium]|nr:DUF3800 domain-containing protein [Bacteroidota bacterium]